MSVPHDQLGNPKKWRLRAEQMRVAAEDIQDPTNKATALRLADDYDRIAKSAEEGTRPSDPDNAAEAMTEVLRSQPGPRAPEPD
jgi:hypothetical protein